MEHTECRIGMKSDTAVFIIRTSHRFLTFVIAAPNHQERISWRKSDVNISKMHGEVHFSGRPSIILMSFAHSLRTSLHAGVPPEPITGPSKLDTGALDTAILGNLPRHLDDGSPIPEIAISPPGA